MSIFSAGILLATDGSENSAREYPALELGALEHCKWSDRVPREAVFDRKYDEQRQTV